MMSLVWYHFETFLYSSIIIQQSFLFLKPSLDLYWFQAFIRILQLRKYSGTLAYIPAAGYEESGESINNDCAELLVTENIASSMSNINGGSGIKENVGYRGPAPLPKDTMWRSIQGDFILVWLLNVPWAAEDVLAAPSAQVINLLF